MKQDKCKFCDRQKDVNEIRCSGCNDAWHAGVEHAKDMNKFKLKEIIEEIKKIVIED